jgi:hypothetical protein
MPKLIKVQFFKGDRDFDYLLAYREYDDGSSIGGRVTHEEAAELEKELSEDE